MNQCTYLKPKQAFQFKNPDTKRTVIVKADETLWVMSSSTDPMRKQGAVMIGRSNQAMGCGWYFTLEYVGQMFEVLG